MVVFACDAMVTHAFKAQRALRFSVCRQNGYGVVGIRGFTKRK